MPLPGTVLLAGCRGMLGADLAPALRGEGYDVAGMDLPDLDIADEGSVRAAMRATAPQVVINAAAWTDVDGAETDPDGAMRANADGPGVLARACARDGVRLLHFGTDYVFGGSATRPYREEDPPDPINVYGETKLRGEQQVRKALPQRHLIVRTSWLYGAGGPCFPATIASQAASGLELHVVSDQIGSPTWTVDLASAAVALLRAGAVGTVHFSSRDHGSWYDVAAIICRELAGRRPGAAVSVRPVPSTDRPTGAPRPRWSVLDCRRYTSLTGRRPPAWRDALRSFLDLHLDTLTNRSG